MCVNTDSRSEEGQEAKARVYQAAVRCLGEAALERNGETTLEQDGKTGVLVSKRIDSTLRGNIGKEIEGILEAVPKDWKAVVVPAGPRAGRICVGGYVLVEGIPLEKSGAARDPRTPVTESRAVDIIDVYKRQGMRSGRTGLPRTRTGRRRRAGAEGFTSPATTAFTPTTTPFST